MTPLKKTNKSTDRIYAEFSLTAKTAINGGCHD